MLIVLILVFGINTSISGFSSAQALGALERIAESYMQLEEQNSRLIKAVGECKLCGNLILLVDKEMGTQIAQAIPSYIGEIDELFASMETLSAETGSTEIMETLEVYRTETQSLEEKVTNNGTTALVQERTVKASGANSLSGMLFFVYLGAAVLIIVNVIRSIAKPTKNASTHLNAIIEKIEKNEGDFQTASGRS